MSALPATCPKCHSIFPFRGIHLESGGSVIIGASVLTPCPVCGFPNAVVSPGFFQATKDAIEILSGPDSTRAQAQLLKIVAEKLNEGKITKTQAASEAEAISPRYRVLLELFDRLGNPGLMLLLTVLSVYIAWDNSASNTEDSKKMLDAITNQTIVIEQIEKARIQREREAPTSKKSEGEASAIKKPKNRRVQVNKERRQRLKQRRNDFGGSRSH